MSCTASLFIKHFSLTRPFKVLEESKIENHGKQSLNQEKAFQGQAHCIGTAPAGFIQCK